MNSIKILLFVLLLTSFSFAKPLNSTEKERLINSLSNAAIAMPSWLHVTRDETIEQRNDRLKLIAQAIVLELDNATDFRGRPWRWSKEDLAWSVLNTFWWESGRFDKSVHQGKKRGDQGRSICLGQIMYGKENLAGTGLPATRRCVAMAMKHLASQQYRCLKKHDKVSTYAMAKVYAGYVTGHSCRAAFKTKKNFSIAWHRADLFWRLRNGKYNEVERTATR